MLWTEITVIASTAVQPLSHTGQWSGQRQSETTGKTKGKTWIDIFPGKHCWLLLWGYCTFSARCSLSLSWSWRSLVSTSTPPRSKLKMKTITLAWDIQSSREAKRGLNLCFSDLLPWPSSRNCLQTSKRSASCDTTGKQTQTLRASSLQIEDHKKYSSYSWWTRQQMGVSQFGLSVGDTRARDSSSSPLK